jgi:nitrate/TMAO reductase-like tetraheme cytochrome c subunit
MRNKILILGLLVIFVMAFASMAGSGDKDFKYVGAKKCKTCHNSDKGGAQFKIWSESPHAKAFDALKSDAAKEKAKAAKVEGDPTKSEVCLGCHSTAGTKKNVEKDYDVTEGVGCEACHGPGSDYKKMSTMKVRKEAVAAGLLIPDEKTCKNCHKADTPGHKMTFTTFDKEFAKIAHPIPKEADRRTK